MALMDIQTAWKRCISVSPGSGSSVLGWGGGSGGGGGDLAPFGVTVLDPDARESTFIAMAEDDPVRVENALFYTLALKQAAVPVELHVYPAGGHGYGLRRTEKMVTSWPDRAAEWMRFNGWLKR